MAATDPSRRDNGTLPRRFVTRHDIEDAASGDGVLHLGERDVVTHDAAARARDLGVTLSRAPAADRPGPAVVGAAVGNDEQLREAVRRAVVAELGHVPLGLDDAIDRAMASRDR